jgi:hypothetical protein
LFDPRLTGQKKESKEASLHSIEIDRRSSPRFVIPGAIVCYREKKSFLPFLSSGEDNCPLWNISRNGLQLSCQKHLKKQRNVLLKIELPEDGAPLDLKGRVGSVSENSDKNFMYLIRIHFHSYGEKKGQNSPKVLVRIIALEQKYKK